MHELKEEMVISTALKNLFPFRISDILFYFGNTSDYILPPHTFRCTYIQFIRLDKRNLVMRQLKMLVRPMYSNPPLYGARIVAEILGDASMKRMWATECKGMADR